MSWLEKYDVRVPMRDGVKLSCDVRMPDSGGPFPVVLLRTPYNKDVQPGGRLENISHFLDHGYAMVIMDVRGKYESEGTFAVLSLEQEGLDGFDTVEWLAKQPWCNGKVAMTGASYCGYVQLYAANLQPPALACITPGVFGTDGFRNIMRRNGVSQMSLMLWALRYSTGRVAKTPLVDWEKLCFAVPLSSIPDRCGLDARVIPQWLSHNVDSDFWRALGNHRSLSGIAVPALLTGGWYDIYSSSVLEAFKLLRQLPGMYDKVKVVMGPWPHGLGCRETGEIDFGPDAEVDIVKLNGSWIDACCGQGTTFDWVPVRLFVMGVNRWLEAEDWPLSDTIEQELLLAADTAANTLDGDGRLGNEHGSAAADHFSYDPRNPVINIGGNILSLSERFSAGPFDQRAMEQREDMLVYTGSWLDVPLAVIGEPKVELWVASSAPDTDFVVRLCDVYPDGRSINISSGIIRTRYREGLHQEVMMQVGRQYCLRIELDSVAHVFLEGHRLRLEVTSSAFPQFVRNHNTGGDNCTETEFRTAEQTVFHSAACPSRLILPVYTGKI